jgi:DNA-binding MarR family transcriptional regulator
MTTTHEARLHPDTITALSDVIRDVAVLKRDLQREIPSKVPMAAVSVLSIVERYGPMRIGDLAEHLCVDLSVASRHASTLEQHALLERVPSARDGRSHEISLTDAGRSTLHEVHEHAMHRLADALAGWTEADLRDLSTALNRLRTDLQAASGKDHS